MAGNKNSGRKPLPEWDKIAKQRVGHVLSRWYAKRGFEGMHELAKLTDIHERRLYDMMNGIGAFRIQEIFKITRACQGSVDELWQAMETVP